MDALVDVDIVQRPTQLAASVAVILVVRQINLLLSDGSDQAPGITALRVPGRAGLGHADLGDDRLERLDIG